MENKQTNQELIGEYLNFYQHSPQSVKMRKSSLNYFFEEKHFGYNGDIFEINTKELKNYFIYLKNLNSISIQTRKNKWRILVSFLCFVMEDNEDFNIAIPRRRISWNGFIPQENPNSNSDVIADEDEIERICNFLEETNFKHYLIFRMMIENGIRKGSLITAKYTEVNLNYRQLHIKKGKTGEKIYTFSEDYARKLEIYLKERKKIKTDHEYLFITKSNNKYSLRTFNLILKGDSDKNIGILAKLGITKNITCKTFRSTLNTLRKKKMGCDNDTAKILLGHSVPDVNINSYTKYDYEWLRELSDKYNPYKELNL